MADLPKLYEATDYGNSTHMHICEGDYGMLDIYFDKPVECFGLHDVIDFVRLRDMLNRHLAAWPHQCHVSAAERKAAAEVEGTNGK